MYTAGPYRLLFHRPVLMGILNVTPDSFSDGGRWLSPEAAIAHGRRLIDDGADWLDIGGESTHPGAHPPSEQEELRRVVPVIEGLAAEGVPLSIDSYHPAVVRAAVRAGAVVINDIGGGRDPGMVQAGAELGLPYIAMHMQGTPQSMQAHPEYGDPVAEIYAWLGERCETLRRGGVEQLLTDVGIGFGKTLAHNLALLRQLDWFLELGYPIVIGTSRKSWIQKALGSPTPVEERL
ncbi:MAG TPA: dihydropteroate synthase, partial [bacterium]|nr:dihydropteroate synthase [bacterium]